MSEPNMTLAFSRVFRPGVESRFVAVNSSVPFRPEHLFVSGPGEVLAIELNGDLVVGCVGRFTSMPRPGIRLYDIPCIDVGDELTLIVNMIDEQHYAFSAELSGPMEFDDSDPLVRAAERALKLKR